jgi:hypothetical protein
MEWGAGDRTVPGLIQNEEQKRLYNRHEYTDLKTDRKLGRSDNIRLFNNVVMVGH